MNNKHTFVCNKVAQTGCCRPMQRPITATSQQADAEIDQSGLSVLYAAFRSAEPINVWLLDGPPLPFMPRNFTEARIQALH